jgi:hypothetical protein
MPSHRASASVDSCARANAAPRISSFEKKPASGGMPAMASVAIHISAQVARMWRRIPPMLRMSCASSCDPVW